MILYIGVDLSLVILKDSKVYTLVTYQFSLVINVLHIDRLKLLTLLAVLLTKSTLLFFNIFIINIHLTLNKLIMNY